MKTSLFAPLVIAVVLAMVCASYGQLPKGQLITMEVNPDLDKYMPGQRINGIEVSVENFKGEPLDGLNVTGVLKALRQQDLVFENSGSGRYYAAVDYVMAGDDKHLIEVEVSFSAGEESFTKSTYILTTSEERLKLYVNSPKDGAMIAAGQNITFEAEVRPMTDSVSLAGVEVWIIERLTGQKTRIEEKGGVYSKVFTVPRIIGNSLNLIIYAKALEDGVEVDAAEALQLRNRPVLYVEADNARQDLLNGKVALDVRYFDKNGPTVELESLAANITSYPSGIVQSVQLVKEGGSYAGGYRPPKGDTSADILVWDSFGNSGEAGISVVPVIVQPKSTGGEIPWVLVIIAIVVAVGAVAAFALLRPKKAKAGAGPSDALARLEEEKTELEETIKQTKLDFYKRRIESDVANKRITEAEEKLEVVKKRIESAKK